MSKKGGKFKVLIPTRGYPICQNRITLLRHLKYFHVSVCSLWIPLVALKSNLGQTCSITTTLSKKQDEQEMHPIAWVIFFFFVSYHKRRSLIQMKTKDGKKHNAIIYIVLDAHFFSLNKYTHDTAPALLLNNYFNLHFCLSICCLLFVFYQTCCITFMGSAAQSNYCW